MRSSDAEYNLSEDPAAACDHKRPPQPHGPSLNLLVGELHHRIRNLLTVVQSFIDQTDCPTAGEYRAALSARLANLSEAHSLIERTRTQRIPLVELLEQTLKPFATARTHRIHAAGPAIEIEPKLALSLHMVFHELVTNASKHGALTASSGQVEVLWELFPNGAGQTLAVQWRERGGPDVREPDRKGFGLRLVTKVLQDAQVELKFETAGLVCRMLIEIDES
jgi:two-component sensor histidine kinase